MTGLFDGVLLDWSGTLVHDPEPADRLRWALGSLGRPCGDDVVQPLMDRLEEAALLPELAAALRDGDRGADLHRTAELRWYRRAGLDDELAARLYDFDARPDNRPLFPDVLDVLRAVRAAGIRTVLLSDIHLDLRPLMARHGAVGLIDDFVLSYEHGRQKPDPEFFRIGLRALGTAPERTAMIGDLPDKDGGATALGIPTLILPRVLARADRPRLGPLHALLGIIG